MFDAIDKRRTDRSLYDGRPLTGGEKTQLTALSDSAVVLVEDKDQIAAIAKATEEATVQTLSRPDFKSELSHWVRNNWTLRPDGMPGYAMGVPAPVSLLSSFMVKVAPIHKQEGPKTRKQAETASAIAIIATPKDDKRQWLRAGQLLEQLWLEATSAGLAAAPLTASIEAGTKTRERIRQAAGTTLLPHVVLRIGHSRAKNLRASPRRSVEDCLKKPS